MTASSSTPGICSWISSRKLREREVDVHRMRGSENYTPHIHVHFVCTDAFTEPLGLCLKSYWGFSKPLQWLYLHTHVHVHIHVYVWWYSPLLVCYAHGFPCTWIAGLTGPTNGVFYNMTFYVDWLEKIDKVDSGDRLRFQFKHCILRHGNQPLHHHLGLEWKTVVNCLQAKGGREGERRNELCQNTAHKRVWKKECTTSHCAAHCVVWIQTFHMVQTG